MYHLSNPDTGPPILHLPPRQFLVKAMPVVAFRVYQAVIRGANNIVGGISFVTLARLLGVQKAATPEIVAIAAEVPKALAAASPSAGKAGKK